jgi:hypothetical protein
MAKNDDLKRIAPTKGCAFIAAEDISFAGRDFAKGEAFLYTEIGLNDQHAQNIWDAKLIDVDPTSLRGEEPLLDTPAVITPAQAEIAKSKLVIKEK